MKLAVVALLTAVPAIVAAPVNSNSPARRDEHVSVRRSIPVSRYGRRWSNNGRQRFDDDSDEERGMSGGGRGGRGGSSGRGRGRGGSSGGNQGRGGHGNSPGSSRGNSPGGSRGDRGGFGGNYG